MLTRDQILAFDDTKPTIQAVEVPEWGGSVTIKVMSGADRDRWEAYLTKNPGENIRARLVALCACDELGRRLFTEADISALGAKSSAALHRVFTAAIDLNAIGKQSIDALEKNSDPGISGATPSDFQGATESPTSTD